MPESHKSPSSRSSEIKVVVDWLVRNEKGDGGDWIGRGEGGPTMRGEGYWVGRGEGGQTRGVGLVGTGGSELDRGVTSGVKLNGALSMIGEGTGRATRVGEGGVAYGEGGGRGVRTGEEG
jgi:hypothetical protein